MRLQYTKLCTFNYHFSSQPMAFVSTMTKPKFSLHAPLNVAISPATPICDRPLFFFFSLYIWLFIFRSIDNHLSLSTQSNRFKNLKKHLTQIFKNQFYSLKAIRVSLFFLIFSFLIVLFILIKLSQLQDSHLIIN